MKVRELDPVTLAFLGVVLGGGLIYTVFKLTPSSYGVALAGIGAPEDGPLFGTARPIRSDEWAGATSLMIATVRNNFERVNETSFYREDLRSFISMPLKDWSLIFKPEMWAFFVLPPATAFALYYAIPMCAFLVGYFLLFRQMNIEPIMAAPVTLLLYFSGFTQFWWTTFGYHLSGLPWILLILFSELRWWRKALLFAWVIPVVVFSFVYPVFFVQFLFVGIVVAMAMRPGLFRSPRELAAVAIGGAVTCAAFFLYYHELMSAMANTWYPGKRIAPPGTVNYGVALSQFFPYLTFNLSNYQHFAGANICEGGTAGSFLPLLTLCVISPKRLWADPFIRRALAILGGAVALIAMWQFTKAPLWIGKVLMWDHGEPQRLLFTSGFLITVICLLIWRQGLLKPERFGIVLFLIVGPIFSCIGKKVLLHLPWQALYIDLALCVLCVIAGATACAMPAQQRIPFLVGALALMNAVAFGRFNPVQSSDPMFQLPETEFVYHLRKKEAATPGNFVALPGPFGATLNGMGFRSVSHVQTTPNLAIFRQYFPAMDEARFDYTFNRYSNIQVAEIPLPEVTQPFIITLPVQAFDPARNMRHVSTALAPQKACLSQSGGAIEKVTAFGEKVTIEGWAPWKGETEDQELRVTSGRALEAGPLLTIRRPDIAEAMQDYSYTRSGFRLQLTNASGHGQTIRAEEISLIAVGTAQGAVQIAGGQCPH